MKRYKTDHIVWHCRFEEITGIVLATVGVAIVCGVALNTLTDQPTQHSGTQTYRMVAR
jgi:hypothetical protein|tara:strand:+ start:130 stop:303 length:174 start_codon:yes stop_codon:yes gene_type:complete